MQRYHGATKVLVVRVYRRIYGNKLDTNDYIRRIRYALMLDDADALELVRLGGITATLEDIVAWRLKEGEAGYADCPDASLAALLTGLILQRRGPPPEGAKPDQVHSRLDNNVLLKQLRIALSLRSEEVHALIQEGGGKLAAAEVGAFFRKPDHRNYRSCGDQVMRWFLNGLALKR